jgi:D-serine deaminase-like pyridoxal phosphate-dependent protein
MVHAGIASVLVANQMAGERKLARLARLERVAQVIAATDSREHACAMDTAARAEGVVIPVLIEVDIGMERCGAAPGEAVVALAKAITGLPGLRLEGLMGWEGHSLSVDVDARPAEVTRSIQKLTNSAQLCREAAIDVNIVSASGSGTFLMSASLPGLTEVQAGGGVFSDLSYAKWGLDHEFAITILTRVVSRPSPLRIVVDGGFKTMSQQHGMPQPLGVGAVERLALSAEHGSIWLEEPDSSFKVGDPISFIPGYTDSTLCLHDELCVVRNGVLEAVWAIPGRTGRR